MADKYSFLAVPTAGLNRRISLQTQPPFTTPACSDYRATDPITGRNRGGPRPGNEKVNGTQLGSGNPVKLLGEVRWSNSGTPTTTFLAASNGKLYQTTNPASGYTEIANYTAGITLDTTSLMGVEFRQAFYILGDSNSDHRLCKYTPSTDTLALMPAGPGDYPTKCTILTIFQDCFYIAGDAAAPWAWYKSRQGDPTDWDYTVLDDVGCAISAATSDAGGLGEPIRALIPHANLCMLFVGSNSAYVLRGNPNTGGSIIQLTNTVGIVGPQAWCQDEHGNTWWVAMDGIYRMPPGCGDQPVRYSRDVVPQELMLIDRNEYTVTMCRDSVLDGISIGVTNNRHNGSITSLSSGTGGIIRVLASAAHNFTLTGRQFTVRIASSHASANGDWTMTPYDSDEFELVGSTYSATGTGTYRELTTHWWIDTSAVMSQNKIAIWPETRQKDHEPFCQYQVRDLTPENLGVSRVWQGCRDGYVRRYRNSLYQDDGSNAIPWYVDIGPIRLGPEGYFGLIRELALVCGTSSGDVTMAIRSGVSAEEAFNATAPTGWTRTFTRAGLNYKWYVRVRDGWAVIRLSAGESNAAAQIEGIQILREVAGVLGV